MGPGVLWQVLLASVATCGLWTSILAETRTVYQIGHVVRESDKQPDWANVTFLLDTPTTKQGILFAVSAYFCSLLPVRFQIWRPSDIINRRYFLLTDWLVKPPQVNSTQVIYLEEVGLPCVAVLPGDRLGLYFPSSPGPIPYRFDVTRSETYSYDSQGEPHPVPGQTVQFESPGYPYAFSAAAHISIGNGGEEAGEEPGCPRGLRITGDLSNDITTTVSSGGMPASSPQVPTQRSPPAVTPATTATPTESPVNPLDPASGRVVSVGNTIKAMHRLSEWDSFTYLLGSRVEQEGVIFALSAYFVNMSPVHFQIWRPTDLGGRNFKLVQFWRVRPSGVNKQQVVYLSQTGLSCSRVFPGDRLGIFFPEVPGSIPFDFSTAATDTFMFDSRGHHYPGVGDRAQFDNLPFPYVFSAAAFMDKDMSRYPGLGHTPPCPAGLTISGQIDHSATIPATVSSTSTSVSITMTTVKPVVTSAVDESGQGHGSKPVTKPTEDSRDEENAIASKLESHVGECDWCWRLMSPFVILAILVWLLILTVAMVIAVCVRMCRRKSMGDLHFRNSGYGTMPSDVWHNYFTNSLSSKQDKKSFVVEPTYSHIEEERTAF